MNNLKGHKLPIISGITGFVGSIVATQIYLSYINPDYILHLGINNKDNIESRIVNKRDEIKQENQFTFYTTNEGDEIISDNKNKIVYFDFRGDGKVDLVMNDDINYYRGGKDKEFLFKEADIIFKLAKKSLNNKESFLFIK